MKLDQICPKCKRENLELKKACCEDKKNGWELVKSCPKCGYKERFL